MKKVLSIVLLAALVVVGVGGYWLFRPPAEASEPLTAAPVGRPAAGGESVPVFVIDQQASSARFVIDEILRGEPKTVVGSTSEVAGQLAVDLDDLDSARVGTIQVNARTLTTDAEGRNRMLKNAILLTDQHELITFTPTRMAGLPESLEIGQRATFQLVGDLTIRGTTREATFDVTVTPTSERRLEGTATTTIRYADWGITIPQVPSVTWADEKVALHLDFVATAA